MWNPLVLLSAYALLGFVSGLLFSPEPTTASYWALGYLAVPTTGLAFLVSGDGTSRLRLMCRVTLLFVLGVAAGLLLIAIIRDDWIGLLRSGSIPRLYKGYRNDVSQILAINANGAGRFIAIASIVAISRGIQRWGDRIGYVWLGVAAVFPVLLLYTRSRTALTGFAVAVLLVAGLWWGWKRAGMAGTGVGLGAGLLFGPSELWTFLGRGMELSDFLALGGRTYVWTDVISAISRAPFWGWGFHADRLLAGVHTHGAYLHAWIQAGALGLFLFLLAWVVAWLSVFKAGARERFEGLEAPKRGMAIEATAVLAFLTVRSVSESSGAFAGVDLLILVPMIAYLYEIGREVEPGPKVMNLEGWNRSVNALKHRIRHGLNALGIDLIPLRVSPISVYHSLKGKGIKTVIDVGANEGQFAKRITRHLEGVRILSFEPLPGPYRQLHGWTKSEDVPVEAYQLALGDEQGTQVLQHHVDHHPSSSFLENTDLNESIFPHTTETKPVKVDIERLDEFVDENDLELQPEILVKMDVQGFEDRVIRGAEETLEQSKACLLEVGLRPLYEDQATFKDLVTLLADRGLRYAGTVHQVHDDTGDAVYADLLFLREE